MPRLTPATASSTFKGAVCTSTAPQLLPSLIRCVLTKLVHLHCGARLCRAVLRCAVLCLVLPPNTYGTPVSFVYEYVDGWSLLQYGHLRAQGPGGLNVVQGVPQVVVVVEL